MNILRIEHLYIAIHNQEWLPLGESKSGFEILKRISRSFRKSKFGFLIWWIHFEKGFTGFEIRGIRIQINGLVIYVVPFTVDSKLVRWSSGISSWSIPVELLPFTVKHLKTLEDCCWCSKISMCWPFVAKDCLKTKISKRDKWIAIFLQNACRRARHSIVLHKKPSYETGSNWANNL